MIFHRRKRRWYWPFKTIYLKHDKKASEHCKSQIWTIISPMKKDLDFMSLAAYSRTEIGKQLVKAAVENEDKIMKEGKQ